jgi:hypothetical protein
VAPFAFIALPIGRRRVQAVVALLFVIAGFFALRAEAPTVWPIVLATSVLPVIPLPGRPRPDAALLLPIVLLATTALTHAVFFGDDRYHIVVTPALCLFAAAVLRRDETHAHR